MQNIHFRDLAQIIKSGQLTGNLSYFTRALLFPADFQNLFEVFNDLFTRIGGNSRYLEYYYTL